jgi:tryptophanyl-tRNA synthetase
MAISITGTRPTGVGRDQRQHVEAAREIARAFNGAYGDVLRLPEAVVDERVMTVPGLDGRKMSKSYDNVIPIMAEPDQLRRRVMAIVTDSRRPEEPKDPDEDTVFCLYRELAPDADVRALRARYEAGGGLRRGQAVAVRGAGGADARAAGAVPRAACRSW